MYSANTHSEHIRPMTTVIYGINIYVCYKDEEINLKLFNHTVEISF